MTGRNGHYKELVNELMERYDAKAMWGEPIGSTLGLCCPESRTVMMTLPDSPFMFAVFCHEVGHIVCGHKRPRCWGEYLADRFMYERLAEFGIELSENSRRELDRGTASSLAKALNNGLHEAPVKLLPYKRFLTRRKIVGDPSSANGRWYVRGWVKESDLSKVEGVKV